MDINITREVATSYLLKIYNELQSTIPPQYHIFLTLVFYTFLISLYGIFIWKFYRFLATRDLFKLDLNKYNNLKKAGFRKTFEIFAFFIKFLILFPIIIFFWFAILAIFLMLLSESENVGQIILVAISVVGAVRLTSYISEDLSKDLAKMFPFTLLGVFLLNPNFFLISKFVIKLSQIPEFILHIPFYLIFIFALELIMRLGYVIIRAIKNKKQTNSEKEILGREDYNKKQQEEKEVAL